MWRDVWNRFRASLTDELIGLLLLHAMLRHRRHEPARGRNIESFPALFDGDLESFFTPGPQIFDDWTSIRNVREESTCTVHEVSFPSPAPCDSPLNSPPLARWWRSTVQPTAPRQEPWTIVGMDGLIQVGAGWFARLARELTPQGVDVVMVEAPFNFRRTPRGYRPGQLIVGGDMDHQLGVARQGVLEFTSVVRTLIAQGRRVGVVGLSYGGWMSLMTTLLVDGLRFAVTVAPPVDLRTIVDEGGTIVRASRRGLGHRPLDEEAMRRAARAISPVCWQPRLDPARIMLHAARYDRFVPTRRIVELSQAWGAPLTIHETGHIGVTARGGMLDSVLRSIEAGARDEAVSA